MKKQFIIAAAMLTAGLGAQAANISITNDIVTSAHWTSNNVYSLEKQIYVRPGASLIIDAGTLVASTSGGGGSLAVSRGARIYVNGTKEHPVVMTSTDDDGTARVSCNEWGNLTLMGRGLIAASTDTVRSRPGNTKTPTGLNEVQMEGLIADGTNDVMYGGADDNDDSGTIHYLSLRYGGKVIGLNNELNGLSMGGIGRDTDVDYVDIFNNVDDGIETWGGAVNYRHLSIWNIGDDSLDIDQGWRGKAQFGLIVQGLSQEAPQGSGWGDNCFETDGAEDSDASPATHGKIANFTVVGQPDPSGGGDGCTTWRDDCRLQYENCIFMNIGEEIVRLDGNDGDGSQGYSYAVTGVAYTDDSLPSWTNEVAVFENLWTLPYTSYYTNNFVTDVYNTPADMYPSMTSGYLCEIRNCVMYQNAVDAQDLATDVGVYAPAMNNTVSGSSPIKALTRGALITYVDTKGKTAKIYPVTYIDPRAANDAVNVGAGVASDDFFTSVNYAGAFSPNYNWLAGWTAASEYGLTDSTSTDAPTPSIATGAAISFQSEDGLQYGIERSADAGGPYSEIATVTGDGTYMTYMDEAAATTGFYKVVLK